MLQKQLLNWYGLNQRDLPWRKTKDPYVIWLSEVILQQTRVAQGLPYFEKFLKKYPSVLLMAAAKEDQILKLWQGLGYYSRARNMHHTAQLLVKDFKGKFPDNYSGLIKLKGIGPYTAAAIASFAYDEAVAVLDGNVFRVLARLYLQSEPINTSAGKKIFTEIAGDFLNKKKPALHNQALMELGSIICKPKQPLCNECPLKNACKAFALNKQDEFPKKENKLKVRKRYFHYFVFRVGGKIAMYKRPEGDIWQNLIDLPVIEGDKFLSETELSATLRKRKWISRNQKIQFLFQINHILTHQRIEACFFLIQTEIYPDLDLGEKWLSQNSVKKQAISRLIEKFFECWKSSE